jgi:hypothetical protein
MDTFKTKANNCPSCGKTLEEASDLTPQNNRPPGPGDIGVCHYCNEVLEFCADGTVIQARLSTLMKLTKAEHREIDKVIAFHRSKKGPSWKKK